MDLAIIGAGPVGLFAAFQAGLLGIKSCVIDSQEFVGGQCSALYPEKPIYDIPAHSCISGDTLTKNLETQAKHFNTVFHLGEQVTEISREDKTNNFILKTPTGKIIQAKTILIAAGLGVFLPNKPRVKDIENYENKSIFYSIKNRNYFKNKDIVIFGGGDSAADWTIDLVDIAKSTTLVHRREQFRCAPASMNALETLEKNGKLNIERSKQLIELKGNKNTGELQTVTIADADNNTKELKANASLFFLGASISLGPIINWQLNIEKKAIKVDPSKMSTNISGIFGAGDIITYPGKLQSIVVGFGEAVRACYSIHAYLNPNKTQGFIHSTSQADLFTPAKV
ncbi:MAG: NAD(P)/FAD-dependent oxidoreductase [Rickettsiales bacterium]|nr:NAD(P)/FAD-dependent oxidoreductase [Rickettsiales bacterium]